MQYVEMIKPVVKKAGDLVMSHFGGLLHVEHKKDHSIVTDVDIASEALLKSELMALIPGSGVIAEESGVEQGNEFMWVIDPIDGTSNFSRGVPYFNINVALTQWDQVVAGVTYYPALGEWFYAQKSYGSFKGDNRLDLTQKRWSEKGVLVVLSDYHVKQCDLLIQIKKRLKSIDWDARFRVYGAAALDMAYAASGVFDVVIFENLGWWDAAAGKLLIQEAGGLVSDFSGGEFGRYSKSLIAGHKEICNNLLPLIY